MATGIPRPPEFSPVTRRPSTSLNGWAAGAHVGDYELGVAQAHNHNGGLLVTDSGATQAYSTPDAAFDGMVDTKASKSFSSTHDYAGCVWAFSGGVESGILRIASMVPTGTGTRLRDGAVWYSLDGGTNWILIYEDAVNTGRVDDVILTNQDMSQVRVMAFLDGHDDCAHEVHDIAFLGSSVLEFRLECEFPSMEIFGGGDSGGGESAYTFVA